MMINRKILLVLLTLSVFLISGISGCEVNVPDNPTGNVVLLEEVEGDDPYENYKVNMFLSKDLLSFNNLPLYPKRIVTNYYYSDDTFWNVNGEYYRAGYLYFYTDYHEEDISCIVEEYYDLELNDKFLSEISQYQKYSFVRIGYEVEGTPSKVRYEMECTGFDSNIKSENIYTVFVGLP